MLPVIKRETGGTQIAHPDIVRRLRRVMARSGRSACQISLEISNDPNLFADLARGREMRRALRQRVETWLQNAEETA